MERLPFRETVFDNSYQTMPETAWNYWNLIKFNEHEREDGTFSWLMRKDQCMHCADPGCLRPVPPMAPSCNTPTASSIFSRRTASAAVLRHRLPVQYSEVQSRDQEDVQVHAVLDRVGEGLEPACIKACPTGCLHFGSKDDMKDLAEKRAKQLREHFGTRMPASTIRGRGRNRRDLCAARSTNPEAYGGLPPLLASSTRFSA
jgi:formate dehydrogenase iron-sulfur subunit